MNPTPIRVLFVCLGNICRSPMAEGLFRHLVAQQGLSDRIVADSAGTSSYHIGELPDARTCQTTQRRNIELTHRARQFSAKDFQDFDYILAADQNNLKHILRLKNQNYPHCHVHLLRDFDPQVIEASAEVPDPYYGTMKDFEEVFTILERSCSALLTHIRKAESW